MRKTWAEKEMERLNAKGREHWNESDWEAYYYIKQVNAETDYYDCLEE